MKTVTPENVPEQIHVNALSLPNEAAGKMSLPRRLKVFNWGANISRNKGTYKVGPETLAVLPAAQARYGFDRVALDFMHNTVKGTAAYAESEEPRKVAAYGVLSVVEDDGVYLEDLKWTPEGQAHAANFHDLSPAPSTDEHGNVVFVHSVALCRQGELPDIEFLAVDLQPQETTTMTFAEYIKSLSEEKRNAIPETITAKITEGAALTESELEALAKTLETTVEALTNMEGEAPDPETLNIDFRALLVDVLGAEDNASDEMLAAKAGHMVEARKKIENPDEPAPDALSVEFEGLKKTVETLSAELATLKQGHEAGAADTLKQKRQDLVDAATREGKVIPLSADAIDGLEVETLSALVDGLPVTVPLGEGGAIEPLAVEDGPSEADEQKNEIFRNCGLETETPA